MGKKKLEQIQKKYNCYIDYLFKANKLIIYSEEFYLKEIETEL